MNLTQALQKMIEDEVAFDLIRIIRGLVKAKICLSGSHADMFIEAIIGGQINDKKSLDDIDALEAIQVVVEAGKDRMKIESLHKALGFLVDQQFAKIPADEVWELKERKKKNLSERENRLYYYALVMEASPQNRPSIHRPMTK